MQNQSNQDQFPSEPTLAAMIEALYKMTQQGQQKALSPSESTSGPEIIDFQEAAQKNKQPTPSSSQESPVPATATDAVDLTANQTPPNTAPAAKSDDNAAVPPQSEQKAQSGPQTEAVQFSASTLTRPVFDEDQVLPAFREELRKIFDLGTNLEQIGNEYQRTVQDKAIQGLAKILGVRRKYFDAITPEVDKVLFEDLYQQCKNHNLKGRTKRTTEFHLLSRLHRQSDRKQASADAKILIRAHNEGQTEETFADWVKEKGSLSKILKEIVDHERAQPKSPSKINKKKCAKRVADAVAAAATVGSWATAATLSINELPEAIKVLTPPGSQWRPIVVKQHGDDLHFYILPDLGQ